MKVFIASVLFFAAGVAAASEDRTIWLQPGHCIVVGSQQVCAVKSGDTSSEAAGTTNKQTHVCKDGIKDEADPNLKGWGHVVITTSPAGKKLSQEVIKTYGPLGKKECEANLTKYR